MGNLVGSETFKTAPSPCTCEVSPRIPQSSTQCDLTEARAFQVLLRTQHIPLTSVRKEAQILREPQETSHWVHPIERQRDPLIAVFYISLGL